MKLGLGLYRASLSEDNFKFARQAGATHLVDYFRGADPSLARGADIEAGWGVTTEHDRLWDYEELAAIKQSINRQGLVWEAIENLDPAHWFDVLLDGPRKKPQLENLKILLRTAGRAGVPILGYNFSVAGVWGWTQGPFGRGGAVSVGLDADRIDVDRPIPKDMVLEHDLRPRGENCGILMPLRSCSRRAGLCGDHRRELQEQGRRLRFFIGHFQVETDPVGQGLHGLDMRFRTVDLLDRNAGRPGKGRTEGHVEVGGPLPRRQIDAEPAAEQLAAVRRAAAGQLLEHFVPWDAKAKERRKIRLRLSRRTDW